MVHGGCWVVCDMSFSFCWWMAPVQVWWELHRMASCVTRLCWLGKPSRCSGWSKKNVKEPSTKNNRACYWVRVDVAWTCASSKWGILFLQTFVLFLKVAPNSKRNIFGEVAKMLANNKRRCVYMYMLWYCWWKESGVHQLRLVVYLPISLQGLSTIQPVVGLGISEPSTGNNLKIPACRRGLQVGCTQNPSCWWSLFSSQDAW